jgi:hypothetical protein
MIFCAIAKSFDPCLLTCYSTFLFLRLTRYESAEGCYALAVSQRQDLRVKYAVKAFTDAAGGSELGQEV